MATVILGGGIIGLSTAYYLSQESPRLIKIVDAAPRLLASSSGLAGGFLAKDWFAPSAAELGALSFELHHELTVKHDGWTRWGYTKSTAFSMSTEDQGMTSHRKGARKEREEDWLLEGTSRSIAASAVVSLEQCQGLHDDGSPLWLAKQEGGSMKIISSVDGCAQVEPMKLCEFLRDQCEGKGVQVWTGMKAIALMRDEEGNLKSLKIQKDGGEMEVLECSNVVIAAGAWTPRVFKSLFPESGLTIPIEPLAGHSCTVRSQHFAHHTNPLSKSDESSADGKGIQGHHAVFSAPSPRWKTFAPEAISRAGRDGNGEVFVAGLNSKTMPLPELATDSKIDEASRAELREVVKVFTGEGELDIVREAVCFRPAVTQGISPIVGEIGKTGVFIASGHGPWGISLSLGTGKVVSEMIRGVKTSADVRDLGKVLM